MQLEYYFLESYAVGFQLHRIPRKEPCLTCHLTHVCEAGVEPDNVGMVQGRQHSHLHSIFQSLHAASAAQENVLIGSRVVLCGTCGCLQCVVLQVCKHQAAHTIMPMNCQPSCQCISGFHLHINATAAAAAAAAHPSPLPHAPANASLPARQVSRLTSRSHWRGYRICWVGMSGARRQGKEPGHGDHDNDQCTVSLVTLGPRTAAVSAPEHNSMVTL